ncbi:hypothetical protein [Streptomyces sp. NPDC002573]|uniref:hypothetical protein n=1 Tax=Streptomyces sp. NPDC002573 TaxID=3364651 RepID=UPI003697BBCA
MPNLANNLVEAAQIYPDRAAVRLDDLVLTYPKGHAITIGHPLGKSGGRILGTLAKALHKRDEPWGRATTCIGIGQGLAVVLENTAVDA